jgi:hypothetical protein
MKPGPTLSGMQQRNIFGGQAMQGWRLFDGPDPQPQPPPPPPPAPPRVAAPAPAYVPPVEPPAPRETGNTATDLANTRAEAASYRIRARDAEEARLAAEARATQAAADADQRVRDAEARAATTANKIKSRALDAELRAAATAAGIRDADFIPLIDRAGITVDDDGNVAGVDTAIAALKAKKPDWFAAAPPPAPAPPPRITGAPGTPPVPGPTPPPGSVKELPKGDYEAQKRAALRALK